MSEHLLCYFASYLANAGLAPQTIKSYLSAVRSMQIQLGLPDPRDHSSMPLLKRVQAGIARLRSLSGRQPRTRLPITAPILAQIRAVLDASSHPQKVIIWCVACTAFFGFFRLGELLPGTSSNLDLTTVLAWGDVALDNPVNPSMVRIHLKRSKCDQFGKGVNVFMGRTHTLMCPVAAIAGFMAVRGAQPGAFFTDGQQGVITKAWFTQQFRAILDRAGLPQHCYAGHSFRIGAATTAALAGVEDSTIQALGRWHSSAFLQYIRMPRERLAQLSRTMAQHTPVQVVIPYPTPTPS